MVDVGVCGYLGVDPPQIRGTVHRNDQTVGLIFALGGGLLA